MEKLMGEAYYSQEELESFGFRHLGKEVKIKRNVGIYYPKNLSIGDYSRIDDFCIITSNQELCEIGKYVHIASHCVLLAKAGFTMKDYSGLSPMVTLVTNSDDYSGRMMTNPTVPRNLTGGKEGRITLGKHVIIGTQSVILPDVTIEEGSSVGAMSLVNKSLEAWGIYFGIPVKRLKDRKQNILQLEKSLYNLDNI
jgi:acetyltransferase-like isoleucine patch superfamily enzyme